jgi:hypothetical protein
MAGFGHPESKIECNKCECTTCGNKFNNLGLTNAGNLKFYCKQGVCLTYCEKLDKFILYNSAPKIIDIIKSKFGDLSISSINPKWAVKCSD